ncbi:hypothetical protein OIU76_026108 [Salix suchowensis]|nr:hypothetical protein OIU76_026108 [Salix suchowensis]
MDAGRGSDPDRLHKKTWLRKLENTSKECCSSQMNMSRILGAQPFGDPELFRLATSMSSSQRDQTQNSVIPKWSSRKPSFTPTSSPTKPTPIDNSSS